MASVRVFLYTSRVLNNGEHLIMLRLIKDRKIKNVLNSFENSVLDEAGKFLL